MKTPDSYCHGPILRHADGLGSTQSTGHRVDGNGLGHRSAPLALPDTGHASVRPQHTRVSRLNGGLTLFQIWSDWSLELHHVLSRYGCLVVVGRVLYRSASCGCERSKSADLGNPVLPAAVGLILLGAEEPWVSFRWWWTYSRSVLTVDDLILHRLIAPSIWCFVFSLVALSAAWRRVHTGVPVIVIGIKLPARYVLEKPTLEPQALEGLRAFRSHHRLPEVGLLPVFPE